LIPCNVEPSVTQVLNLLSVPRCGPELRDRVGVSRQRIHQILTSLVKSGVITKVKVSGERGRHVYARANRREGHLTPSQAAALSRLSANVFSTTGELGLRHAALLDLNSLGLIVLARLGNTFTATLTPKGLRHPQYGPAAPKAEPADLGSLLGKSRTAVILALSALKRASAAELSVAIPRQEVQRPGSTSSHIVASLRKSGLITASGSPPMYSLSPTGLCVAAALNSEGPFHLSDLRSGVERRRQEVADRRREIVRTRSRAGHFRSPSERSIFATLAQHGPLTAHEIIERAEIHLQNWRSIRLVLHSLERRGLLERAKEPSGALLRRGRYRAFVWQVMPGALPPPPRDRNAFLCWPEA
jgi:predicted transcriptional regulator